MPSGRSVDPLTVFVVANDSALFRSLDGTLRLSDKTSGSAAEQAQPFLLTSSASVERTVSLLRERGVTYVLKPVNLDPFVEVAYVVRSDVLDRLEVRARQEAAVAEFGWRVLLADDLATLLNDAVAVVARTLEVPLSSVLERRSDGVSVMLRAAVGSDQLGQTIALAGVAAAPLFRELGAVDGMTVTIPGSVTAYGVLAAHDRRARTFTDDDIHFLQAIAHVLGTAIERNRTEAAFRQAQRLEAVGRLASEVAHDFNNTLAAITGYAGIVRNALATVDPLRKDVDEILGAAGRAATLTRRLLAVNGQQVLEPRVLMLNDVVVPLKRMLYPLLGSSIKLVTDLSPDLGLVEADPTKIEQVLLGLCVNARDAMPDGGTLLIETMNAEVHAVRALGSSLDSVNGYVMLTVSDTGIGMDTEMQAIAFEPFFGTKSSKSTGLGLASVYAIVKQSGGEIRLHSEPHLGTTIQIFLPRVDDSES